MAFRDGRIKLTGSDLVEDLEDVFGMEAKPLFPGAVYFAIPGRLQRDMTESTDWNLICPSIKKDPLSLKR